MERLIQIVDNGSERYSLKTEFENLGRQYDNNAESIVVEFPQFEIDKGSTCTMAVFVGSKAIDYISIRNNEPKLITNVLSRHERISVSFFFQRKNGYLKNSEKKMFSFLQAQKPDEYVEEQPEQKGKINELLARAIVENGLNGNTFYGKNLNGDIVNEFDLSPFTQEQSDLGQTDSTKENFVKGKKLSNLENDMGFLTQDDIDLSNYYTKKQTNNLLDQKTDTSTFTETVKNINIVTNTLFIEKQNKLTAGNGIKLNANIISTDNSWTLYDEITITQEMVDQAGEEGITSIMLGDGVTKLPTLATEICVTFVIGSTSQSGCTISIAFDNGIDLANKWRNILFYGANIQFQSGSAYVLHTNLKTRQTTLTNASNNLSSMGNYSYGSVLGSTFSFDLTKNFIITSNIESSKTKFKFPVGTKVSVKYR